MSSFLLFISPDSCLMPPSAEPAGRRNWQWKGFHSQYTPEIVKFIKHTGRLACDKYRGSILKKQPLDGKKQ
jgi:hypothetical protein